MTLYNKIGNNYARTRISDPRLATTLLEILQPASINTVVDIGAGTGSYARILAEAGYQVLAIEPSATMRNQANYYPKIQWFDGSAENLPLADRSVDAAIMMLAFHHFQDYRQALREVHRVTRGGKIAIFTYDPDDIYKFWLTRYFPSFIKDIQSTFIPISELISAIKRLTNINAKVAPILLPHDLIDSFAAVGWARPELYLDANIRNGISTFAKLDPTELNDGLLELKQDLESGAWDREFGYLRQQQYYDVGYRFIHTIESHP
jgi:ubiquinone/menaquinone biosynthesis C-methylase UbiE